MKLVDLNQTIFIPIVDESKGGVEYEMQMTVGEFFEKCCQGFEPEVVEAIPVEWIKSRWGNNILSFSDRQWCEQWLIDDWQKEQEAQDG